MDTKHRIMEEALTLFSEKGYANVFVAVSRLHPFTNITKTNRLSLMRSLKK